MIRPQQALDAMHQIVNGLRGEVADMRIQRNNALHRLGAAEMQLRMAQNEIAMWKDRYEAANRDHEATIAQCNEFHRDVRE